MLSIVTTVPADIPALWEQLADDVPPGMRILDRRTMSISQLIRRVLEADGKVDVLLLNGSGRADQLAAALLWRRRSRTAIVISDCTWKLGSSKLDGRANRLGLRAIDSARVRYCVLSTAEVDQFPRTWRVDGDRVVFTPFCYTLTQAELAGDAASDGSVFAGGDSMRDYGPLLDAAARLHARVAVATRAIDPSATALPPNVEVGPAPPERFAELMRRAAVVVVPLKPGIERSAGQQTYLSAMALGKIVIATDSPGVRDYIESETTGLVIPPGDADALERALSWALDPANGDEVEAMRVRARETARSRFTPMRHLEALIEVATAAVRDGGRTRPSAPHMDVPR